MKTLCARNVLMVGATYSELVMSAPMRPFIIQICLFSHQNQVQ